MKIYVTNISDEDNSAYSSIFLSEEKAKNYCEVQSKIYGVGYWYTEEETAADTFDATIDDVKEFYNCFVLLDSGNIIEEKGTEYLVNKDNKDFFCERTSNVILVYSTISREHARSVVEEQYKKYLKEKQDELNT